MNKRKSLLKEGSGIVYHYTSLDTLFKMLDGINNDYLQFHASDIMSMNDPTEFIIGFNKLWKLLPQIEDDYYDLIKNDVNHFQISLKTLDEKFRLSRIWNVEGQEKSEKKVIHDYINLMHKSFRLPFVISFSCQKDFLPMWSTYGDKGYGVALGIDIQSYYIRKKDENGKTLFDFTNYNEAEPHSLLVSYESISTSHSLALYAKSLIRSYLLKIQDFIDEDNKIEKAKKETIYNTFTISSALIKNKVYSYEEESRLVCNCNDYREVKFKMNSHKEVTPYIYVNIPVSKLKEIVLGPCCNEESTTLMLTTRLKQLGIELPKNAISKSCIPYR